MPVKPGGFKINELRPLVASVATDFSAKNYCIASNGPLVVVGSPIPTARDTPLHNYNKHGYFTGHIKGCPLCGCDCIK